MCTIPTTVLWPSRILELVVLLCAVQVPTYIAVFLDHHQELIGSFLMEVGSKIPILYHTTEIGLIVKGFLLEQYFSTVTLRVPQQEFSAVRYLMPIEFFRASMWGYILPPQVNPVHWREACSFSNSGVGTNFVLGGPRCIGRGGPKQDYIIIKLTKPEYTWNSILYTITWSLVMGGGRLPLLDHWGASGSPGPAGSYSTGMWMFVPLPFIPGVGWYV